MQALAGENHNKDVPTVRLLWGRPVPANITNCYYFGLVENWSSFLLSEVKLSVVWP